MIKIYHNPRCSKSRECLSELSGKELPHEIVKYLDQPLSQDELKDIIAKLGMRPIELVRTKEKIWTEKYKGRDLGDQQIIEAMAEHPVLIERPIVISGDKAVIARPLEKLKSLGII